MNDYLDCLLNDIMKTFCNRMYVFKSKLYTIYALEFQNTVLNRLDDKRYILPNGIHTLALGHFTLSTLNK